MKRLGFDMGSTTLKCVLMDEEDRLLYKSYERHYSKIGERVEAVLSTLIEKYGDEEMSVAISGSAGIGIATKADLPFVQEVFAEQIAVKEFQPETDAVIELGGEDAKILFLTGGFEMRMNGTCAGGTGAFIDQMAALMNITPSELDNKAKSAEKIYTIASRCGVFAKSDVQPLLNQGARKEDVSASILHAVVNQTIAGLAQGREIKGNIVYLGGPLTFFEELRNSFDEALCTKGVCPVDSLYYVAMGSAISKAARPYSLKTVYKRLSDASKISDYQGLEPLFDSEADYDEFCKRHKAASKGTEILTSPKEKMYLGIDAGSTTVKGVLCDDDGNIFMPFYAQNNGDPVTIVKNYLCELYDKWPEINIVSSAATGYGEDIIKNAFGADFGLVETIAHYTAAKKFRPDVDFILDIGGQDIKCFRIKNGAIDNIYLNEACSSGCGSFLQTFASALGYTSEEFSKLALYAKKPVDLGSRCTVFMNSSVKQSQEDGAGVDDIAAGLSVSVVKNALYKVIRCTRADQLGRNIVVQGGTFMSDAVLRSFERELGGNVIRPEYAPIMGAFGAALYAKDHCEGMTSGLCTREELKNFVHEVKATSCKGCGNNCSLTINTFAGGRRFIAGNRCERPILSGKSSESFNLYNYKLELLDRYMNIRTDPSKKTIGIPMGLNNYELLPFWYRFFTELGFNVVTSPLSTREIYVSGQYSIPSDTACYPAKLMHGHIEELLLLKPDAIFYPNMSYNIDEHKGVDHYNCPVVAYYPQVLAMNVAKLKDITYIDDFVGINDRKQFVKRMSLIIAKYFPAVDKKAIEAASSAAFSEYDEYMRSVRQKADEYLAIAKERSLPVIILAGRPYHLDPEVNHGIDRIITRLGAVVLSEDSVSEKVGYFDVDVRNQWTYHSRLYAAAKFVADSDKRDCINLVQLVSFGCGVDAITSDEARAIVERSGKIYTMIKIDEISNMGTVKTRLRSLFSAVEDEKNREGKNDA